MTTSTKPRVTAATAKAVLAEVRAKWPLDSRGEYGPTLVRNYEFYWGGGTSPYAILWEGGPSDWVHDFLGYRDQKPDNGVFLEAGTSFILLLFPEWTS